jgi:hypothetical protein
MKRAKVIPFLLKRRTILSLFIFLFGCYVPIFIEANINITALQKKGRMKYDQYYNVEIVNNKSKNEFIVYPGHVYIYNHEGDQLGQLMSTPVVYSINDTLIYRDSLINVQVFGWVWKKSLDENGQLMFPENIRFRANSHIIGSLNAGTMLDTLYTNELNSWTLITFFCYIPEKYLLTNEEFHTISRARRFFTNLSSKTTETKRTGGVSVKPATRPVIKFEHLIWPVRLIMSLFGFLFIIMFLGLLYIPRGIINKRKRRIELLVLMLSGMIAGCLLRWECVFNIFK